MDVIVCEIWIYINKKAYYLDIPRLQQKVNSMQGVIPGVFQIQIGSNICQEADYSDRQVKLSVGGLYNYVEGWPL